MKKFISLTQKWVEENGQGTLAECVDVATQKIQRAHPTDPAVFYVCEVRKIVSRQAVPVRVVDVREVE